MKYEIFAIATLVTLACFGQQLDLSSLDKLAAKAKTVQRYYARSRETGTCEFAGGRQRR